MKTNIFALLMLASLGLNAQETMHPSPAQTKKIVISGGTLHIGNGQVIENGTLSIEKGKIKIETAAVTGDVERIDATGKHVYPGIIAPNTNMGLVEVASTKSTADFDELGDMNPSVRSIVAYNTDSKVINTVRSNGVLLAQIVPQGGLISGSSTVVQLDAWNWEDAAYALDNGIHMTFPALINRPMQMRRRGGDSDPVKLGLERIEQGRVFFREAKAYLQEKTHAATNLKFEATRGLFDRSKTLYVHCDLVKEMLVAIDFAKEFNFKLVIAGGADSYMIADILAANNVAVILHEPHALPATDDDAVDQPYKTGAQLQKAGVLFSICQDSGDGYTQIRNLPFLAGTMSAYGLTKEEALAAITLNPAKIMGIADRTGSLENGKDANIVISTGDILDMKSSVVTHAFIQGRAINLDNKHTQLFNRYKYKYGL
ncbi:amidohydrolase family protein [Aquirufa sp.]|jgi:imidazolonepropionase-like amidohydrolase|uniref:amidohydrolase family protein n=1 Tax=Aquirufa sp. TaxID=2676249 RepID=UPI0037BFF6DC